MKIEKKNRIAWVDRARSVAVLCVILCHATERSFFFAGKDILEQPIVMQTLGFFLFTIGRLGVPIFLFISGFLLLQRTYEGEMSFRFWRHNFLPLLGVTECWIIIYNLFLIWYEQRQISLVGLVKNMLFLENVGLPHFWYLPMILGIYLIHIPIMEVINRYLSLEVFTGFVRTVILFVATLILSWGTVKIVSKNPKLGKFLFLIK